MSVRVGALAWSLPPGENDRGRLPRAKHLSLVRGAPGASEEPDAETLTHASMSLEEFLELERGSSRKHEYVGGRVYAMAGASDAHNTITTNLVALLRPLVRKGRCRLYAADMLVRIDDLRDLPNGKTTACYYPDVMVSCSEADAQRDRTKKEPTIVIEVLSKSTSARDRGVKLEHYRAIPSLVQYWLISQDRCHVDVYERQGRDWMLSTHRDLGAAIAVAGLDGRVSISELYEDVRFGAAAP